MAERKCVYIRKLYFSPQFPREILSQIWYLSLVASHACHSTQPVSRSHQAELIFSSVLFTLSFVTYSIHEICLRFISFLRHYVIAGMLAFFSFLVSNIPNWLCPSYIIVSIAFFFFAERSDIAEKTHRHARRARVVFL